MRYTIVLMIVGVMQVSANSYSQSLNLRGNYTIKTVFKTIKAQTGYDVLWQPEKFDADKSITVNFVSTPLREVISQCLSGTSNTFDMEDLSIIIREGKTIPEVIYRQDSVIYKGRVSDDRGNALAGATIKVVGGRRVTFSDAKGDFAIYAPKKGKIEISYIGYQSKVITVNGTNPSVIFRITLIPGNNNLGEVNIVSTGYQDLPRERATGSFEVITKEQLQHSTDPNVIRRLEGITTSINFNNNQVATIAGLSGRQNLGINGQYVRSPATQLTIRGKNTLNIGITPANKSGNVLIVIDGIASPYSIDRIDPNNVESITLLKDAAAASIWGSRAANGVIVIKSKRGKYDSPLNVSFNNSFVYNEKIDLYYRKSITTSQYIDAEVAAFNAINPNIVTPDQFGAQSFISPVFEILNQRRLNVITAEQAAGQLNELRRNDIRKDYKRFIVKNPFTQNYSLGLDGGSKKMNYRLFGAYNVVQNGSIASGSKRLSLNYDASIRPIKDMDISFGVAVSDQRSHDPGQQYTVSASVNAPYYPYIRLVDDQDRRLSIGYPYRPAFVDLLSTTYQDNIPNLNFVPLNEVEAGYLRTKSSNINFYANTSYKLGSIFSANLMYNYSHENANQYLLNRENSFYVRNLIAQYTMTADYADPVLGPLPYYRQVPQGGQLQTILGSTTLQTLRGQINANKKWNERHELSAIAGMEFSQNFSLTNTNIYLGYNEHTRQSVTALDYSTNFPLLFFTAGGSDHNQIPYNNDFSDYNIKTNSLFSNAAYTFLKRYTVSGSIRKDLSSEFGQNTNKGGTPFYSFGSSWNIAAEDFYEGSMVPILKLRATFGYNGNVNPAVTANPIILYLPGTGDNGLSSAIPFGDKTNSRLRAEKTEVLNFGVDFGLKNNRITGSMEYYIKKTTDLLTPASVDPSTGSNILTYNAATIRGSGIDLSLNSRNLQSGIFTWGSTFLFSFNRVKVKRILDPVKKTAGQVINNQPIVFTENEDLSRLYAFRWAGLDPKTGDPMGIYNGAPVPISPNVAGTANYNLIVNSAISNARYFGSAVPVYFGSLRNTFGVGQFAVSVNLLYKLGYYFRRPTSTLVNYSSFLTGGAMLAYEFNQRWQQPGDELYTNVPSLRNPSTGSRETFYQNSEINVLKADHIRIQEINFSYSLNNSKWFIKNPRIFANISNLGVVWRANRLGLDPDIFDFPNPRSYSFGFSANF